MGNIKMTKNAIIKSKCPNCCNPELMKTGFWGGRWCPLCKYSFQIICRGKHDKPETLKDYTLRLDYE